MKKVYKIYAWLFLSTIVEAAGQITYFEQNFSAGTPISQYQNASPTNGQFTNIAGGTSLSVGIVNQALEFDRQVDNSSRGYAARTVDFSPLPSSLYIQFKFQVVSATIGGTNAVKFYVGSGFNNTTPNPTNAQTYARFAIDVQNNGSYAMNPLPAGGGGSNSQTFSGWQTITFILNKTSSNLQYLTPTGALEQQPIDTYDLWVGNTKVSDNQAALTPSQVLSDFRITFEDGVSKIAFDDFLIRDISGVLPVTLLSFTAKPEGDRVQLAWTTTMERNADRFIIERSADLSEYVTVGELTAKGTTNERQNYGLTDLNPQPGINYYRLKQIDLDGAVHQYRPISAIIKTDEPVVSLFPNPASPDRIHLRLWNADNATIRLIDSMGQPVNLRLERQPSSADLFFNQPLAPGIYWIETKLEGWKQVIKVLIR